MLKVPLWFDSKLCETHRSAQGEGYLLHNINSIICNYFIMLWCQWVNINSIISKYFVMLQVLHNPMLWCQWVKINYMM